ncbi:MAG: ABC transporter substrate-binding protein [Burkholderiales bacterium]|nr:ABC transporter substrate-binding protein [Burkholderiales bacterium]
MTLQLVTVGSTLPGALASNSLQIGTLTPPVFLLANEGGVEIQIVAGATLQTKSNVTLGVAAREGSNIKAPADFRGKKVAVPGLNGVNHVMLMKWLKSAGVDPKQVTFVEGAMPQLGDMLKSGSVDAVTPVEPFLTRINQTKVGYTVAPYGAQVADSYLEAFYTMTRAFAQANPKVVADFRAAIREAVEYIAKNPAASRKSQVTYLKLPEAVAMSIPLPTFTVDVRPADVQFWVDTCRDFGITKGTAGVAQVLAK